MFFCEYCNLLIEVTAQKIWWVKLYHVKKGNAIGIPSSNDRLTIRIYIDYSGFAYNLKP
jgi:hypothetical protein